MFLYLTDNVSDKAESSGILVLSLFPFRVIRLFVAHRVRKKIFKLVGAILRKIEISQSQHFDIKNTSPGLTPGASVFFSCSSGRPLRYKGQMIKVLSLFSILK